jgi:hypothetical protein
VVRQLLTVEAAADAVLVEAVQDSPGEGRRTALFHRATVAHGGPSTEPTILSPPSRALP